MYLRGCLLAVLLRPSSADSSRPCTLVPILALDVSKPEEPKPGQEAPAEVRSMRAFFADEEEDFSESEEELEEVSDDDVVLPFAAAWGRQQQHISVTLADDTIRFS